MASLFNRNNNTTIAELEEYYANQRSSDGTLRAWAMAILSLVITIAVILALFFAGRWLWRVIDSNDTADTTTATQTGGVIVREDGSLSGDVSNLNSGGASVGSGNPSAPSSTTQGVVTDEAASTETSNSADSESNASSQLSVTAGTTPELPNTGANSVLVAVPAVSAAAGYAISRRRQLNR